MSFFPLDRNLFNSSLWISGTPEEKVIWIWLLGHKDTDGIVRHREIAITDGVKLPRAVVEAALAKFAAPDPDSRTAAHDGRRIDRTDDGFVRILNHSLYFNKDYSTPRWKKWKERKSAANATNAANMLANAPTPLATKNKDKDTDKNRTKTDASPAAPLASGSWTREACDDWIGAYRGTAPGGRIGKALSPLVKQHGWDAVRTAWKAYLSQTEAEYASPQRFASTFGRWSGAAPAPAGSRQGVIDRNRAVLEAFVKED